MKKIFFYSALFIVIVSSFSTAQEANNKSWGISAAIQGTQLDFLFPIWTGKNNMIAPGIGLVNIGGSGTDLRLGLIDRIYFNTNKNVQPFIGGRGGVLLSLPSEGETMVDYIFGILGGGEYFFGDNFSIGVEAQLNFSISNEKSQRFGNPGETNINTASVIFATVYF